VDVGAAFIADDEAAKAAEPGETALDDPTVSPESLARLAAAPGDSWDDAA